MSNREPVIPAPPRRRPNAWAAAVHGVVAAVLAVSALLKAQQAASEPVPTPAFVALQAGCEWLLAVWLISRIRPRLAHRAVAGLMALFCGVSLWSFWQGAGSCGCFGRVPVPPLLTAGFDLAAAILLFLAGPLPTPERLSPKRLLVAGAAVVTGSIALLPAFLRSEPGRLTPGNGMVGDARYVVPEIGAVRRAEPVSTSQVATTEPLPHRLAGCVGGEAYDLGYILPGTQSRVGFRLRNPSSQPWRFKRAISECGCARVESYPASIPPGQEGEVVLLFAAPDQNLLYRKPITFIPEGDGQPLVRYLTARIGIPLALEPDTVDAGRMVPGRPVTRRIRVLNDADDVVALVNATSGDPACVLELSRNPVGAHAAQALTLTIDPADKAAGKYSASIDIQTGSSATPHLSLAVTYEVLAGPAD